MANLWLYNSPSQTISVGDTLTIYAKLDPDTVSSSISAYTAKMWVDGSLKGSSASWETSGTKWVTECSYKFSSEGTYEVAIALCSSSGSYTGEKTGTITITVNPKQPAKWSWSSSIGAALEPEDNGDGTYSVYPVKAREWNRFLSRIEEWVDYLNTAYVASAFGEAEATSGTIMKASQARAVVGLLNVFDPPIAPPDMPYETDDITVDFFEGLANSLNSLRT